MPDNIVTLHDGDVVRYDTRGGVSLCRVVEHDNGDPIGALLPIIVCEACEIGEVVYETTTGAKLCGGCVERVLTFRIVSHVLDNVGEYDTPFARAINALDDDDAKMRTSGFPYVDSESSAWDAVRGESRKEVEARVYDLMRIVVDATREPGDVA